MAKNQKTVKLYTGEAVVATSSKGNQEKWYEESTNCWYKLDRIGFEAFSEAVSSEILREYSNVETELGYRVVPYWIETVDVHGGKRNASVSQNFLVGGQSVRTVYHVLKRVLGPNYQGVLAKERSIPRRLEKVVESVEQVSGLSDFGAYLTLLFEIDALFANEDRHLNNIAILAGNGGYWYCPIFDNGECFMLDNVRYPFDVEIKGMMRGLRAKPFGCRFSTLLTASRKIYGEQLKIDCSAEDVEEIAEKYLEWYQPMFRDFLRERVAAVVELQMKKYF